MDPLAEKYAGRSPYEYCFSNPINLIDPTGMGPDDWIKNEKTGKYEWRNEVTKESEKPKGYEYIGKEDNDIVKDLFGKSSYSTSDWDAGLISTEDFDNPYSAKGAALMNMSANTTMSVTISADVETKYDNGNIKGKEFKGIKSFISISGNVNAPYPDMNLSLITDKMTLQGNKMDTFKPSPNGYIMQGGDVKTLAFETYWNAKSIQSNANKSYNLDFKFKGFYSNNGRALSYIGASGLLGVTNYTNLSVSVPFKNTISLPLKPIKP